MLNKPLKELPFGHIVTSSGTVINLLKPDPNLISIRDIASSLSKICRFGGNLNVFYSVAQHSCLVAWLSPPELYRPSILHDASETYCGDVIRPLKKMLGTKYSTIEEGLQRAIFERFNVDYNLIHLVKEYDDMALEMEEKALFNNNKLFQDTIGYQSATMAFNKPTTWWWDFRFAEVAYTQTFFMINKNFKINQKWSERQL